MPPMPPSFFVDEKYILCFALREQRIQSIFPHSSAGLMIIIFQAPCIKDPVKSCTQLHFSNNEGSHLKIKTKPLK